MGERFEFPEGFLWGTATAGHQIEGGNVHSNWWEWEQQGLVNDGTRSGRACDYWNRYESDHQLMVDLGHNVFRLGVEWSRIEPDEGRFDTAAIDHYRAMLDDLQAKGLKICLTLHHWVLPSWLWKRGGWLARDAVACWERFLRRVVPAFGDRVDLWVTLNEPIVPVLAGYLVGYHPPCRRNPPQAVRVFGRLLEAHAVAYAVVHELATGPGGGPPQAGFAGAYQLVEPFHEGGLLRPAESAFSNLIAQVSFRGWDESVRTGHVKWPWGFGRHIPDLEGSIDFVGVNYYMRVSASLHPGTLSNVKSGGYACPPGIEQTEMGWQIYPPGFTEVFRELWSRFRVPLYVTENGCCGSDEVRRRYLISHIAAMHDAIRLGCDVRGYMLWSFMDNFEWREGYEKRFGIVAMDHDDPELTRRPRPSAEMLRRISAENALTPEIVAEFAPGALDRWR